MAGIARWLARWSVGRVALVLGIMLALWTGDQWRAAGAERARAEQAVATATARAADLSRIERLGRAIEADARARAARLDGATDDALAARLTVLAAEAARCGTGLGGAAGPSAIANPGDAALRAARCAVVSAERQAIEAMRARRTAQAAGGPVAADAIARRIADTRDRRRRLLADHAALLRVAPCNGTLDEAVIGPCRRIAALDAAIARDAALLRVRRLADLEIARADAALGAARGVLTRPSAVLAAHRAETLAARDNATRALAAAPDATALAWRAVPVAAGLIALPLAWRLMAFFVLAPLVTRPLGARRTLADRAIGGRAMADRAMDPRGDGAQPVRLLSDRTMTLSPGMVLRARFDAFAATPDGLGVTAATQLRWPGVDARTALAMGLADAPVWTATGPVSFALADGGAAVGAGGGAGGNGAVAVVAVADDAALMLRADGLAGVLSPADRPVRLTRAWPAAWAGLAAALRLGVWRPVRIDGPAMLLVTGTRGLRAVPVGAGGGVRLDPALVRGWSAALTPARLRAPRAWDYLLGRRGLFDLGFADGPGVVITSIAARGRGFGAARGAARGGTMRDAAVDGVIKGVTG